MSNAPERIFICDAAIQLYTDKKRTEDFEIEYIRADLAKPAPAPAAPLGAAEGLEYIDTMLTQVRASVKRRGAEIEESVLTETEHVALYAAQFRVQELRAALSTLPAPPAPQGQDHWLFAWKADGATPWLVQAGTRAEMMALYAQRVGSWTYSYLCKVESGPNLDGSSGRPALLSEAQNFMPATQEPSPQAAPADPLWAKDANPYDPGHRLTEDELKLVEKIYNDVSRGRRGPPTGQRAALEAAIRSYLDLHWSAPTREPAAPPADKGLITVYDVMAVQGIDSDSMQQTASNTTNPSALGEPEALRVVEHMGQWWIMDGDRMIAMCTREGDARRLAAPAALDIRGAAWWAVQVLGDLGRLPTLAQPYDGNRWLVHKKGLIRAAEAAEKLRAALTAQPSLSLANRPDPSPSTVDVPKHLHEFTKFRDSYMVLEAAKWLRGAKRLHFVGCPGDPCNCGGEKYNQTLVYLATRLEHMHGSMWMREHNERKRNEQELEPQGTYSCPHCGKDSPHQHAIDSKGNPHDVPSPVVPPVDADEKRGIYSKYRVSRTDGSSATGGKHEHCHYYVLDLVHDRHAFPALIAYAGSCASQYPALADDIRAMAFSMSQQIEGLEWPWPDETAPKEGPSHG